MTKSLREYMNVVLAEGFEIVSVATGKHHKMTVRFEGREKVFVFPVSPSDHRGILNFRLDVRRMKREKERAK